MGPRKHNRTPYPPCTHACFRSRTSNATKVQDLVVADVKGGPCTRMCRRVGPCKTKPVSGNGDQKTQTNTELPIHRAQLPAEDPGHQMQPMFTFWSWQMWERGRAHACAAGMGRAKRDQSQEMGPGKHKQIQNPSAAHTCQLKGQDIKCHPCPPFGHGRCGRGAVHMHVPPGWAVQNETGLRKWGPENTNKYRSPHPPRTHAS